MAEPHILLAKDWSVVSMQELTHQLMSCADGQCTACRCGAAMELARRVLPRAMEDSRMTPTAPRPRIDLDKGPKIRWSCPNCLRDCERTPGVVRTHPIDGLPWDEGSHCAWCRLENLGFEVRQPEQPGPFEVLTAEGEWLPWPEVIAVTAVEEAELAGEVGE